MLKVIANLAMKMLLSNKSVQILLLTLLFMRCSTASADVIHVTSGISVAPGSQDPLLWDVDGNGTTDFSFTYRQFGLGAVRDMNDSNYSSRGTGGLIGLEQDPLNGSLEVIANLPFGFNVAEALPNGYLYFDSKDALPNSEFDTTSGFEPNVLGNIGFRFLEGSEYRYGWARLMFTIPNSPSPFVDAPGITITDWYYEDSGGPLEIAVPEPSGVVFVAGTAGIAIFRRWSRKRKLTADAG